MSQKSLQEAELINSIQSALDATKKEVLEAKKKEKKINEFISSKIDKFEFSKGEQAPEDISLLWIYNNNIKAYNKCISAWRNIGVYDKDHIDMSGLRITDFNEQFRKL